MPDSTLHRLLDDHLRLPPEYRSQLSKLQLSNHLPMALQALHAMGAGETRLRAFRAAYVPRFEGACAPPPANAVADWRALRGQADAYPALLASFMAMQDALGTEATLRRVLPDLWPGVAAAALHGLIRTAHALESGHAAETAHALAYWAWRWQPLAAPSIATLSALRATPPAAPGAMTFSDWSTALAQQAEGWRPEGGLISQRMDAAQAAPAYQALAGALAPAPELLKALATFAAQRYAQTGNFTLLHLCTGCRAARVLLPFAEDPEAASRYLLRAYTAGYLASGAGVAETAAPIAPLEWDAVRHAAMASDDEHVVKLVHACREQAAAYGAGPWLQAAARAVAA